jgi:preprotein translocase subunit SecG
MPIYLTIAQIVLAVALIIVLALQVKGGGLGGIFGQADGVYRTKRGVEKTLFQVTIVLTVLFVILSIVIVRVSTA